MIARRPHCGTNPLITLRRRSKPPWRLPYYSACTVNQIVARRGRQCGVTVYPRRFRHHFSHTWLDRGGAERDPMELNGWTSPQMLTR